jgi:hypothetical protein
MTKLLFSGGYGNGHVLRRGGAAIDVETSDRRTDDGVFGATPHAFSRVRRHMEFGGPAGGRVLALNDPHLLVMTRDRHGSSQRSSRRIQGGSAAAVSHSDTEASPVSAYALDSRN